jgi:hypothetical protein
MKIPIDKLKEYINTMETLGINELEVNTNYSDDLPEMYCLFIPHEPSLIGVSAIESTTPRCVDAIIKLQDKPTATLLLNIN